jgi:hypothetical protein
MAKLPGFISGANAKILLDSTTLAFASDVSYNVDTLTVPVECIGRYEVLSNEPIAYGCNGTFTIIRYTKQAKVAGIAGAATDGNSPSQIGATDSKISQHMNPAQMLMSKTFDLEIYQKFNQTTDGVVGVFKISDCRITRRGATLNKRGILVDTYAFVGILATDVDGTDQTATTF